MSMDRDETARRPRFELGFAALVFVLFAMWFTWTPITRLGRETLPPVDALQSSPHLAHPDSALLSPFTWMHCALPLDRAALLEALLKLFLAGFLTYGCLRSLRLAPIACLFGASAFLFSGTFIEHLARPRSAVALALPAGLWVIASLARKLEQDPSRGEVTLLRLASPVHAALMIAIVVFGCAAGDPETFAHVALLLAIFAVARGWSVWKRAADRDGARVTIAAIGAQLGLIACLAACLCAVQLVPFAEYLSESSVLRERLAEGTAPLASRLWSAAVFPNLLGDPATCVGPLTLFCALLAPFVARGRRALTFFTGVSVVSIVLAYDAFGLATWMRIVPVFRLVSADSGLPVIHFALAVGAAFFVHHVYDRGANRNVVAAVGTLCAALTALFVARAGAARLVADSWSARSSFASDSAAPVFTTGAWFMAGAALIASVWMLRERKLRLAAIGASIVVLVAVNAAPFLHFPTTSPNAFVIQETPAIRELASRAGRHLFLGASPLPPRMAAMFGLESFANADGIGIARVERLRDTLFVGDDDGTSVRFATRRGLQLFGIDHVLVRDEWIHVDTFTGFAADDSRAEYLTGPLVPDAQVELDFAYPHERTSGLRVEFETGSRPLLQNIELEVVDRVTEERLAHRVLAPDFQNPNAAPRVFGILPLPPLSDWKSRKLRLVARSNDGVTASAWSLVARRDWKSVMNLGFWRRDGVEALPVELRHPEFTGFACRQYDAGLRGAIVVDIAWNADAFREDGALASYRVLELVDAVHVFRTVSRALAAADAEDALTLLKHPAFDPARAVVLEVVTAGAAEDAELVNEPVEVLVREAHSLRLRTTRARPGWLVTSQPWYPGWRALVNGVERPILRANYAFGAVALDAGASEITFEYEPWSIVVGAWLSCAALAAIGAWFVLSRGSGLSRRTR